MGKVSLKPAIIIFLVLLIYGVGIYFLFFKKDEQKPSGEEKPGTEVENPVTPQAQELYILLSPNNILHYNGSWESISNPNSVKDRLFATYVDNSYVGKYYFTFNDKWYFYDEENEFYNYEVESDIVAINGTKPYTVVPFTKEDLNTEDYETVSNFLIASNITISSIYNITAYKAIVDYDKDSVNENVYIVSNAFSADITSNKAFGYIFVYDDGEFKTMYSNVESSNDIYNICMPSIQGIIDIDVDGNYEFITNCEYFSENGRCKSIYQYKNGKFEAVKACF